MKHSVVLSIDELFAILGHEAWRRLNLERKSFDVQLQLEVKDGLLHAIEVILWDKS